MWRWRTSISYRIYRFTYQRFIQTSEISGFRGRQQRRQPSDPPRQSSWTAARRVRRTPRTILTRVLAYANPPPPGFAHLPPAPTPFSVHFSSGIQFFRYPGQHHFFIIFSIPVYADFGSILDPNFDPKWLQNRLQRSSFQAPNIDLAIFWFLQPIQWFLMVFGVPGGRKTSPNARKLLEESLPKVTQILMESFMLRFLDFWRILGPSWTQFSSKIAHKGETEFNSTPLFWCLRFFSSWGYPQAPIWVDFWLIWIPILVYFGTNKRTRNCYNKPEKKKKRHPVSGTLARRYTGLPDQ